MNAKLIASENPLASARRRRARVAGDARIGRRRRLLHPGKRDGQMLEAVVTPEFLDEVDVAVHVHAPCRSRDVPAALRRRHAEAQRGQDAQHLVVRHGHAEQAGDPRLRQEQRGRLMGGWIRVDEWRGDGAGAELLQQLRTRGPWRLRAP